MENSGWTMQISVAGQLDILQWQQFISFVEYLLCFGASALTTISAKMAIVFIIPYAYTGIAGNRDWFYLVGQATLCIGLLSVS